MSNFGVEIFCDRHHERTQVDVFTRHGGEWSSQTGKITFLAGDVPLTSAGRQQWAAVERLRPGSVRQHYENGCRRCSMRIRKPWAAVAAALDKLAEHRVKDVSLTGLRASV